MSFLSCSFAPTDSSNATLVSAKDELTGQKSHFKKSKKLLSTVQRQDATDRLLLWGCFGLFLSVAAYIMFKRSPDFVKAPVYYAYHAVANVAGSAMGGGPAAPGAGKVPPPLNAPRHKVSKQSAAQRHRADREQQQSVDTVPVDPTRLDTPGVKDDTAGNEERHVEQQQQKMQQEQQHVEQQQQHLQQEQEHVEQQRHQSEVLQQHDDLSSGAGDGGAAAAAAAGSGAAGLQEQEHAAGAADAAHAACVNDGNLE